MSTCHSYRCSAPRACAVAAHCVPGAFKMVPAITRLAAYRLKHGANR
jgi:hypothetical protein